MNKRIFLWLLVVGAIVAISFFLLKGETVSYDTHRLMNVMIESNSTATLDKIQKAFNNQDYTTANTHLSRLAEYYKDNDELQLYYGISLMETNQHDMARMSFEKIASGNSAFKEEAQWYLALNAFKQNDKTACKDFLSKIPKEAKEYNKAQALLCEL
jgi:thioredoxin-like negative regulator of GroEL